MSDKMITYLTQRERFCLEEKLKQGVSIIKIAKDLGLGPSTFSREIKTSGQSREDYRSLTAEDKYAERRFKINFKNFIFYQVSKQ